MGASKRHIVGAPANGWSSHLFCGSREITVASPRHHVSGTSASLESRACWCQRNIAFEEHVSTESRSYQEAARQEDTIGHRTRVSAPKATPLLNQQNVEGLVSSCWCLHH